jgi:putative DNA primase/helicase
LSLDPTRRLPSVTLGRLKVEAADAILAGIRDYNERPHTFQRDGQLCRLRDVEGTMRIDDLDRVSCVTHLSREFRFMAMTQNKQTKEWEMMSTDLSQAVAEFVLAEANHRVPVLNAVRYMPAFGLDGTLRQESGYDPGTKSWLALSQVIQIPEHPTASDLAWAMDMIDSFLHDFRFVSQADRANAIAFLLLPFLRNMIIGPTPLHLVASNTPGAGKGKFVKNCGLISTGIIPNETALPREEAEVSKTLVTKIRGGDQIIMLDNLDTKVNSAILSMFLTGYPTVSARLLGTNKDALVNVNCIWAGTGNDVQLNTDNSRRTNLIAFDPGVERPWQRTGFLHEDLDSWVAENRFDLFRAGAILIYNWIQNGRPNGTEILGTFNQYSHICGGVLMVNNIPGFLGNREEFFSSGDNESEEWRAFYLAWEEEYAGRLCSVGLLFDLVKANGLIPSFVGDKNDLSKQQRLWRQLQKKSNGRIFAGLRCVRDYSDRMPQYRLERVEHVDSRQEEMVTSV